MYSRETYFRVKEDLINSGLTINNYFKMINKSPGAFYKSKKIFDSDCKIEPVIVTKLAGQDEEEIDPLKISGPISFDADFSMGEFIMVNGLKIEGNAEFLKEVLVKLLKESENV